MYRSKIILMLIIFLTFTGCNSPAVNTGIRNFSILFNSIDSSVWSPDGKELLLSSSSYSNQSRIYILDLKNGWKRKLLEENGLIRATDWSPDGSKIAFVALEAENYRNGIWIMNLDGKKTTYIGSGVSATWSSKGDKLAILSCNPNPENGSQTLTIRTYEFGSGEEKLLFTEQECSSHFYISWSPNDNSLVFSYALKNSFVKPISRIYLYDFSTSQVQQIIDEESWSPTWFSDGNIIAFGKGSNDNRINNLALFELEEQCEIVVSNLDIPSVGVVSWSPDGAQWAITGSGELYLVDIESIMGKDYFDKGYNCP